MANGGPQELFDCIVLGAGIAGVTAARDLQKAGCKVLLVEGSSRIGGRIYSKRDFVKLKGQPVPLEAGAEYIHVEHHQNTGRYGEFWGELRSHGFTPRPLYKCGLGFARFPRNRLYFPDWPHSIPLAESFQVRGVLGIQFSLNDFRKYRKNDNDISARTFAKRAVEKRKLGKKARDLLEYTLSAHTPAGLDALSILGSSEDRIPEQLMEQIEYRIERDEGGAHSICGYDALPREIARAFEKAGGKLLLSPEGGANCKVVQVALQTDGNVQVTTKDAKRYRGRSTICTFSVGMLDPDAGEGKDIFGSFMNAQKRRALEVVKMGAITKFSLAFKARAWDDDKGQWSKGMTVLSNPRGKARTFFSAYPTELKGPHVLTGLLMNQDHQAIAEMDDAKALAHVFDALGRVYGPRKAAERKKQWCQEKILAGREDAQGVFHPLYNRQDWSKDPFAKGGNSYLHYYPKSQGKLPAKKAREELKNPTGTLPLFWAGEATAPAYDPDYQPLAVHGAWMSGVRVAEDVLHYLKIAQGDAAKFRFYYRKRYPLNKVRLRPGPVVAPDGPEGGR